MLDDGRTAKEGKPLTPMEQLSLDLDSSDDHLDENEDDNDIDKAFKRL